MLVSVIIPTYNRANTIHDSINSILEQSLSDLEVVVVDDGSSDNTENIVRNIDDKRVRYIKLTNNSGACHARNVGIVNAKGKYIAFQDSDDLWSKDKLLLQYETLKQTESDLIICSLKVKHALFMTKYPKTLSEGFLSFETILTGGVGSTQTFFGKKEVFDNVKFNEKMPRSQDTEILMRIAKRYKIYFLDKPLCVKFEQNDSLSHNVGNMIIAQNIILEEFSEDFKNYPKAKAMHLNAIANSKAKLKQSNFKERIMILFLNPSLKNLFKLFLTILGIERFLVFIKIR